MKSQLLRLSRKMIAANKKHPSRTLSLLGLLYCINYVNIIYLFLESKKITYRKTKDSSISLPFQKCEIKAASFTSNIPPLKAIVRSLKNINLLANVFLSNILYSYIITTSDKCSMFLNKFH